MSLKTWFITGCSSGLGQALAKKALESGNSVIATARNKSDLAGFAWSACERCRILELDVTDPESVREAIGFAGRFDVLVNNAGRGLLGAVEECEEFQIRDNFEVNFFGALNLIRACLPMFREQKSGHIFNFSAAAAISNYPGFGAYGAAKAALEALSESLRLELAPFNVRVTIVRPGPFRTDFVGRGLQAAGNHLPAYDSTSGKFARLVRSTDRRQPGNPDLAAKAILEVAASASPPLRLTLGRYANQKARRKNSELERELCDWEQVGLGVDFELPANGQAS
ncbi:NADP-dependent 3-hydroxy acid dehydrogenase YdfG [Roseimicrobium gellanilyticum]|uniref:NADP-dependent 3-hydroxy acid dehydrogenase YdfG n=1 Tax=Roseimicrobium gellanilyticum TaxID=748857 RepID=A0A366H3K5_9BACT|nr:MULTISPECIES: SDR family NAD(P)-dependent oxidoreductase [Roseimicrobium]QIF02889.1 SDR family NAD(P)-dependent oxidoreductase [Roseimicrobium sp. ORNL1]RBP35655.1 NADP-dependent 3-hydroxy acid dehydrogenase YdfG [Roseimicrobium gellanilyticum]